jgi:hypothetical protein
LGNGNLSASAIVIAISAVAMLGHGQMRLAGVGLQALSGLDGCLSGSQALRGVIVPKKVKAIMHAGQFAPGEQKHRVTFHRLIEKLHRLHEVAARQSIESHGAEPKGFRPGVKIERYEVRSRPLLDRRLFRRRKFSL